MLGGPVSVICHSESCCVGSVVAVTAGGGVVRNVWYSFARRLKAGPDVAGADVVEGVVGEDDEAEAEAGPDCILWQSWK